MDTLELTLPKYWASALINGDLSGYEDEDLKAMEALERYYLKKYERFWCVDMRDDGNTDFRTYHDAKQFGVLSCDVAEYIFDVHKTKGQRS